jgi:two-component system, NtrC family, response regulator GlrR
MPHTQTDLRAFTLSVPSVRVTAASPDGDVAEALLGIEPIVVGTEEGSSIVVRDRRVSRRHCQLSLIDRGVVLRDLGSKNGTFIAGVQILEAFLPEGAVATIGGTRLSIRTIGSPRVVPLSARERLGEAVGGSVAMRALFATLERAAATSETIVVLGESGTGKEVLARSIHDASPRKAGPFVVLDCSAAAPSLLEAELFGHEKGAFTGADRARPGLLEQAHGGTLFIDEIGELGLDLQPKLLRAIESRKTRRLGAGDFRSFDARIVVATHCDLKARVKEGAFRQDLYYRLAVVEAHVPPLRERRDDIPILVARFLASMSPPRSLDDLPPNALALLSSHDWPGNVRELRNMVSRIVLFPHLLESIAAPTPEMPALDRDLGALFGSPLREAREVVVEEFERKYLAAKLRDHGGNIPRAAKAMGISRQFAHRLVVRYGLRGHDGDPE